MDFKPVEDVPGVGGSQFAANQEDMLPYVFLGDGGFGCTDLIMTPFTDRGADTHAKIAFNRRLSKARSAVEHAFGIFAKRWRLFLGTVDAGPDLARLYTLAAVICTTFSSLCLMMKKLFTS
uniref:DDE Tnp4 domain-containing protein n=1 Tax=Ditylenchus dipsaci TaxID=166011 RepID=A0A915CRN3_9BILA